MQPADMKFSAKLVPLDADLCRSRKLKPEQALCLKLLGWEPRRGSFGAIW